MKKYLLFLIIIHVLHGVHAQKYALVIHGGAGFITEDRFNMEEDAAYRMSLKKALKHGQMLLEDGTSSVEVVEAVIMILENDSLFNAGKGSVLNTDGEVECDASIMSGANKNAGAIAGVKHIKNPIQTARLVMEKSSHVMLSQEGAELFAGEHDVTMVENDYFITQKRRDNYAKKDKKHGTVGAVALDLDGNIAAGTSTGGMTGKAYGRIGDSPIIGAGTYADNNTCGVSCTGHGEYFIRYAVAYDVSALMEYAKLGVIDAANYIVNNKLRMAGGDGGLIALDRAGNIAMPFNTPGMFRGYVTQETTYVALYKDE